MDSRELVVEVDRARLDAMRVRVAGLLREAHRAHASAGGGRTGTGAVLVQCLRGGARWAGIKLERLSIAAEPTSASEDFDVVFSALERHCDCLESWLLRQAG